MRSFTSKPRLSRSIESWTNSLNDIGIATRRVFLAPRVSLFLTLFLVQICFYSYSFTSGFPFLPPTDVVHAVSYSILLLNTDLHVADLSTRMSRGQFVRNTLTAIQMQLQPSSYRGSTIDVSPDDWSSVRGGSDVSDSVPTAVRRIKRSDSMTSWSSVTRDGLGSVFTQASSGQLSTTPSDTPAQTSGRQTPINSSRVSVISSGQESRANDNGPFVHDRKWESEMEDMLKVRAHLYVGLSCFLPHNTRKSTTQSRATKSCSRSAPINGYRPPPSHRTVFCVNEVCEIRMIDWRPSNVVVFEACSPSFPHRRDIAHIAATVASMDVLVLPPASRHLMRLVVFTLYLVFLDAH